MSIFSRFGKKITSAATDYGSKAKRVFHKGSKLVADQAGAVEKASDTVANIAGTVATGAAMIGLEPVALAAGAVGASAKGIGKVAGIIDTAEAGRRALKMSQNLGGDTLRALRKGDLMTAARSGVAAGKSLETANIRRSNLKKKIERL